jgi:1-acyl-sn-glycerol-3-phosphate acyltransferase
MWLRRLMNIVILRPLAWAAIRTHVTGRENIPPPPFIVAVNHCNFLDPAAAMVALLPREVVMFTKIENLSLSIGGLLLRMYGVIPVERGEADVQAIKRAVEALQAGSILLVAPEGTRSYHGRLQPAKDGMAFIATRADVPILPVGVSGVRDFWSNVRRVRRTHVRVAFGHPFKFRAHPRARKQVLSDMTTEAMYQLAALLPREQWGVYADIEHATEDHLEFLQPGQSNLVYARDQAGLVRPIPPTRVAGVAK